MQLAEEPSAPVGMQQVNHESGRAAVRERRVEHPVRKGAKSHKDYYHQATFEVCVFDYICMYKENVSVCGFAIDVYVHICIDVHVYINTHMCVYA